MSTSASVSPSRGAPRPTAAAPEALRRHVAALLASFKPGLALPGAFFCDDALYGAELEYIFGRHWLFVASEAEIPEGGDYRTFQIGPWPVFILRRDDGSIAAFHNTCRHRGSRILQQDSGIAGATLQCPYHRWSYDLEGRVIGCGATGESPAEQRGLKPVHVRQLAGLIFVCLAEARLGTLHFHTQPNAWFHFLSDHALTFATLPLERGRTLVRSTWLVHADAHEGRDYDLEKLTSVWNATNAQDAAFVEDTQRGASSPA